MTHKHVWCTFAKMHIYVHARRRALSNRMNLQQQRAVHQYTYIHIYIFMYSCNESVGTVCMRAAGNIYLSIPKEREHRAFPKHFS